MRKRREQFLLENEIAEEMAKLSIIRSQSGVGSKSKSKVSDGMNSNQQLLMPLDLCHHCQLK